MEDKIKLCDESMNPVLYPHRDMLMVFGCLMKDVNLLKSTDYRLDRYDFPEGFHRIVFSVISNLIMNKNLTVIDETSIDSYLANYEVQYEKFKNTGDGGHNYIRNCLEFSEPSNFDYHYNRVKKASLLRRYVNKGVSINHIFNDSVCNVFERQNLLDKYEEMTINDIINSMKNVMLEIHNDFEVHETTKIKKAGDGSKEQKEKFKTTPLMGLSFASKYLTSIGRGVRKKALVIRSSDTGGGKSRSSIGDLCNLCATELWDLENECWIANPNGQTNKGLYIGTEMELDEEVEPIFWAYISGVPTDHILENRYLEGEEERVDRAIEILQESNIWLIDEPEFNSQSLENHIQYYKINHGLDWVVFDYIQLTDGLIAEETAKKKGMGIREDMVLIGLSKHLKNLCKKYDIGMITMTQCNADVSDYKKRDYTIIRGGKGCADWRLRENISKIGEIFWLKLESLQKKKNSL